jgi:hypothetical protein
MEKLVGCMNRSDADANNLKGQTVEALSQFISVAPPSQLGLVFEVCHHVLLLPLPPRPPNLCINVLYQMTSFITNFCFFLLLQISVSFFYYFFTSFQSTVFRITQSCRLLPPRPPNPADKSLFGPTF